MVTDELLNEIERSLVEIVGKAIDYGIDLRRFYRVNRLPEEWKKMEEREKMILKEVKDEIDVLRQAITVERAERTAFEADSYRSG